MIAKVTAAVVAVAGLLLCAALLYRAVLDFHRGSGARPLLRSLAAALVALVSGVLTAIAFGMLDSNLGGGGKVTENTVIAAYLAMLLAVPAGMGWGWSSSFMVSLGRRDRSVDLMPEGILVVWLAANVLIAACVIERLLNYGNDAYRIGVPGLLGLAVFIGSSMLLGTQILASRQHRQRNDVLRLVGAAIGASALLTSSCQVGGEGLASLMQSSNTRLNQWNIAIVLYPFWILLLFAMSLTLAYLSIRQAMPLLARLRSSNS